MPKLVLNNYASNPRCHLCGYPINAGEKVVDACYTETAEADIHDAQVYDDVEPGDIVTLMQYPHNILFHEHCWVRIMTEIAPPSTDPHVEA